MIRRLIATGLVMAGLAGCATLPPDSRTLTLLEEALVITPESLEARADKGEARAQYALSVVYTYALNGAPKDSGRAGMMRGKALAMRGYLPITQYIAGLNGKPGRTAIINIPRYDLTRYEAQVNDACAAALDQGNDSQAAVDVCGGEPSFLSLKDKWASARSR